MSPPSQRFTDSGRIREWLTEPEIRLLINEIHQPLHDANIKKFDLLFAALHELKGSIKTGAWIIGTALALIGLIITFKR